MTSIAEAVIDLRFDTSTLNRQLRTWAASVRDLKVKVDGDTTPLRDAIRRAAASITDLKVKIDGDITKLQDAVRRAGVRLPTIRIKLEIDRLSYVEVLRSVEFLRREMTRLLNNIPITFQIRDLASLISQLTIIQGIIRSLGSGGGPGGGGGGLPNVGSLVAGWQGLVAQLALFMGIIPLVIAAISILAAVITSLIGSLVSLAPALLLALPAGYAFIGMTTVLTLGMQGLGKAFEDLAKGDTKAFEKDLKNLTPAARQFALAVRSIWPELKSLQQQAQESIFRGLSAPFLAAAHNIIPTLKLAIASLGNDLNFIAIRILHAFTYPEVKNDLRTIIANIQKAMRPLGGEAGNLVVILTKLTAIASGPLSRVTTAIADGIQHLADALRDVHNNVELSAFINIAIDRLGELWSILTKIWDIFTGLLRAADQGQSSFKPVVDLFSDLAKWVNSPQGQDTLITMFKQAQDAFQKVEPFLASLVGLFGQLWLLFVAMAPTFADWLKSLSPVIDFLGQMIAMLTPFAGPIAIALITSIVILAVAFGVLAAAIALPIIAIGLIIALIVGVFTGVINAIITVVQNWGAIMNWIGGVIGWLVGFMGKGIQQAGSFWASVWSTVKTVTSNVINSIVGFVTGLHTKVMSIINGLGTGLRNGVSGAWKKAVDATTTGIANVVRFVTGLGSKIASAVGNLGSILWNAGKSVIDGLYNGINSQIGKVKSLLGSVTNSLPSWKGPMTLDLKILAPSGAAVMQGFMSGIESQLPALHSQLGSITTGLANTKINVGPSSNTRIEALLKQLIDTTANVGPQVGKSLNGAGRTGIQAGRRV